MGTSQLEDEFRPRTLDLSKQVSQVSRTYERWRSRLRGLVRGFYVLAHNPLLDYRLTINQAFRTALQKSPGRCNSSVVNTEFRVQFTIVAQKEAF